jgi:glycosyltransferase involved in cell wall biosynthesis
MGPKNLHYMEPIHGSQAARADLLGNALAVLMPSRYVEPFGSVAAEALLCGTPVLTSPFGAFTEIVTPGYNGERCRTLDEWLAAVADVEADHFAPRQVIQHSARGRYDMQSLAHRYDKVFRQINDLWGEGWYTRREEVQRA